MEKLDIFWKWKSKFHKCCRNFSQKFWWKIPATSWGSTRLQMFWHTVWWNSINYSRRYSSSKLNKNETSPCQYHHFSPKLMLMSQNWFIEIWGGAPQLWAGKKLFSTNQSKFNQKKILTGRTPFLAKSTSRNCQFWRFSEKQIWILKLLPKFWSEISVEISGNMMGTSQPRNVR